MTSETSRTVPPEAPEAAGYIASLVEELARIAKNHDLDSFAHILDMARLEAEQTSKRWNGSADGSREASR